MNVSVKSLLASYNTIPVHQNNIYLFLKTNLVFFLSSYGLFGYSVHTSTGIALQSYSNLHLPIAPKLSPTHVDLIPTSILPKYATLLWDILVNECVEFSTSDEFSFLFSLIFCHSPRNEDSWPALGVYTAILCPSSLSSNSFLPLQQSFSAEEVPVNLLRCHSDSVGLKQRPSSAFLTGSRR